MPREHKLSTYKDGFLSVDYCRVCGAEDFALSLECPGKVIDKNLEQDHISSIGVKSTSNGDNGNG